MGVFTQAEFKEGFTQMGISTVDDLKRKLPQLYQDLKNPEEFKKMYKFVFDFARDKNYKNLQVEIALDLWDLLLSTRCRFLGDPNKCRLSAALRHKKNKNMNGHRESLAEQMKRTKL